MQLLDTMGLSSGEMEVQTQPEKFVAENDVLSRVWIFAKAVRKNS